MLERVHIRNFKALRDVEVPLRPFTVLIGPNDSGKSSVLQALEVLGRCHRGRMGEIPDVLVQRGSHWWKDVRAWKPLLSHSPARLVHRGDVSRDIKLGIVGTTGAQRKFDYNIAFRASSSAGLITAEDAHIEGFQVISSREGQGSTGFWFARRLQGDVSSIDAGTEQRIPTLAYCKQGFHHYKPLDWASELAAALSFQLIRFRAEALAAPCELTTEQTRLDADGYGLASVIDSLLTGPDRSIIQRIEDELHRLVPSIRGVSLVRTEIENGTGKRAGKRTGKALELVLADKRDGATVTIPIASASDGVILALGYLTLVHTETANCLLIEEPENGLHPSALGFLMDLLKKVSRGEIGPKPRQIILTTHSPLLLNFAEPEDVLIVTRTSDNVKITRMIDTPHFAERFQAFDLGELWYNVGERDLVTP